VVWDSKSTLVILDSVAHSDWPPLKMHRHRATVKIEQCQLSLIPVSLHVTYPYSRPAPLRTAANIADIITNVDHDSNLIGVGSRCPRIVAGFR
jgi:hypothetical protein